MSLRSTQRAAIELRKSPLMSPRTIFFAFSLSPETLIVKRLIPILFAHNGLDWVTGSERCLLDLVAGLDREHFRPVVMCNGASLAAAAEKLRWDRSTARTGTGAAHPGLSARRHRAWSVKRDGFIREERIRLVHANAFQTIKWLLPAARAARIPVVLHVRHPDVTTRALLHLVPSGHSRRGGGARSAVRVSRKQYSTRTDVDHLQRGRSGTPARG